MPKKLQLSREAIGIITNLIHSPDRDASVVGIRALNSDELWNVGEIAPESFVWIDEEPTDETLGGTAAFELWTEGDREDIIAKSIEAAWWEALTYAGLISPEGHLSDVYHASDLRFVVLAGDHAGYGDMPETGAVVISEAVVIAIFDGHGDVIAADSEFCGE